MKVKFIIDLGLQKHGLGHLIRCVGLIDKLLDIVDKKWDIEIIVNTSDDDLSIIPYLSSLNYIDINFNELEIDYFIDSEIIIIDSYNVDNRLLEEISKLSCVVVILDSYLDNYIKGVYYYVASLEDNVIDSKFVYSGMKYYPVRNEFLSKHVIRKTPEKVISIALGGLLSNEIIYKLLLSLSNKGNIAKINIISPVHPMLEFKLDSVEINFIVNPSVELLIQAYSESLFVIASAGVTIYELMAMNKAFIAVYRYRNQLSNIHELSKYRLVKVISLDELNDSILLESIIDKYFEEDYVKKIEYSMITIMENISSLNIFKKCLDL